MSVFVDLPIPEDLVMQERNRFEQQLTLALEVIKAARRPVKMGFIEHELSGPIFQSLEPTLNQHPSVQRKTHGDQTYYTWKAR